MDLNYIELESNLEGNTSVIRYQADAQFTNNGYFKRSMICQCPNHLDISPAEVKSFSFVPFDRLLMLALI